MKAMILAAGTGTRLQPLTNTMPKALIKVCGISMLEHQINYLRYHGVNEIIINVHHFAGMIVDFIRKKDFGCRIEFSDESDQLLETGGGLKKASWFFNDGEPFFLLGSDMFTDLNLAELMKFHEKNTPLATLAMKKRNSTRDFLVNENNLLCGWKNNLTGEEIKTRESASNLTNYGFSVIHVISPEIFRLITETGAFSMTGLYLRLSSGYPVMGFIHNHSQWYELGRQENFNDKDLLTKVCKIAEMYR